MFALQTACRMDLFEIAKARGIQTEFLDGQGHRRVTTLTRSERSPIAALVTDLLEGLEV